MKICIYLYITCIYIIIYIYVHIYIYVPCNFCHFFLANPRQFFQGAVSLRLADGIIGLRHLAVHCALFAASVVTDQ